MRKKLTLAIRVWLSLQLGTVGLLKLIGFSPLYQQLQALNVPPGAGVFIGVWEVIAVALLWFRPGRSLALLSLLCLVAGAIGTHVGAGMALKEAAPAFFSCLLIMALLYLTHSTTQLPAEHAN